MYVYIEPETAKETGSHALYTVGHYAPDGRFIPESYHGGHRGREDAALRVSWLNGGNGAQLPPFTIRQEPYSAGRVRR